MVSCRHPERFSLSVVLSSHLWFSLSLSFIWSLLLSRSFRTCAKPHQLVAASRTRLPRQLAGMAPCPHYSSLCLSVVFSFCLGLSLTRRSSLALSLSLSLSLARARSLLLEGSSTFVPS